MFDGPGRNRAAHPRHRPGRGRRAVRQRRRGGRGSLAAGPGAAAQRRSDGAVEHLADLVRSVPQPLQPDQAAGCGFPCPKKWAPRPSSRIGDDEAPRQLNWQAPPSISAAALAELARQPSKALCAAVDAELSRVTKADGSADRRCSPVSSAAIQARARVVFHGADKLLAVLERETPVGDKYGARRTRWVACAALLRLMSLEQDFDSAALDYCVTFEVSPPSWVAPQLDFASDSSRTGKASAPDSFLHSQIDEKKGAVIEGPQAALEGVVQGDASAKLDLLTPLVEPGRPFTVRCDRLIRIDFVGAGSVHETGVAECSKKCPGAFSTCPFEAECSHLKSRSTEASIDGAGAKLMRWHRDRGIANAHTAIGVHTSNRGRWAVGDELRYDRRQCIKYWTGVTSMSEIVENPVAEMPAPIVMYRTQVAADRWPMLIAEGRQPTTSEKLARFVHVAARARPNPSQRPHPEPDSLQPDLFENAAPTDTDAATAGVPEVIDNPALREVLSVYAGMAWDRQMDFAEKVGERAWSADTSQGMIQFGDDLRFRMQVLGSYAFESGTWQWIWANTQAEVAPAYTEVARQLLGFGNAQQLPLFTQPRSALREEDLHTIGLIAAGADESAGYYLGNYGTDGILLALIDPGHGLPSKTPKPERVLTVVPQLISQFALNHRSLLAATTCKPKASACQERKPPSRPKKGHQRGERRVDARGADQCADGGRVK
ncbi:hypothetical protein FQA39_LY19123 [Lamprigera yunnana]|nr:hypothetical protein FQA39_LY19123 [Lamprigera yunnana]